MNITRLNLTFHPHKNGYRIINSHPGKIEGVAIIRKKEVARKICEEYNGKLMSSGEIPIFKY